MGEDGSFEFLLLRMLDEKWRERIACMRGVFLDSCMDSSEDASCHIRIR